MSFNFRYMITFGQYSKAIKDLPFAKMQEYMQNYVKWAEKYKVKVLFYGTPWGVSDTLVAVFDYGGDIDNYVKFKVAMTQENKEIFDMATSYSVLEWPKVA